MAAWPIRSTSQIWIAIHHQNAISELVPSHFAGQQVVALRLNVGCVFRPANQCSKIITSLKCRMILFCHRCEMKGESLHLLHEAGQPMLLGFLIRVCLHFLFIQTRFGFRESTNFNEELPSTFDLFRNSDNDSAAWTVSLLRYSRVEIACLWPCPYQCVSKTSVSR